MDETQGWDARVAAVWDEAVLSDEERIVAIDALATERPHGDARALFESAGARDSAGHEVEAEAFYRAALDAGLDDEHRPQAVIQLASTLRNLGRVAESVELLEEQLAAQPTGPYADATAAFLALALASSGDPHRATAVALRALVPHLPRYHRSVHAYADELEQLPPR
ncbi:tetratricopeptide repeat protein [Plantibacter sp. LMC-P-059a]|uniref:tetratricopeptide repeat protein n=1 Tax=Plantibacter sp. LMC-P-059a TaxID=3040297 RepID=UPI00254CE89F|nr:tetratricopeptide repeat protein [Plantibacter sp. LMC-P-059a]